MHDLPITPPILDDHNTCSSLYEKTTPDDRRKIDRAIVNRDPPTYRGVFEKFSLAAKGVSFTAFYNYARRIRSAATRLHLAGLAAPDQADAALAVPRLLASLLVDTLLYAEDAAPAAIHRLTQSYASAVNTAIKTHEHRRLFNPRPPVAPPDGAPDVGSAAPASGVSLDDLSNDELCALAASTLKADPARNAPAKPDPAAP